ncbi:flagellar biosynthetic protein FliO [Bradyrhizobium sp. HKCCYLS2038]|uniref:flagellar biosynthetic protein FliO n=1 Tax=unclassified Bradyrhizobium TaxID=2631580 RepID=UPI003EBD59D5
MQALTAFFTFVAVLALMALAAWLVRRFAGNRLGTNPNRGRMPRLAVIDAAAVDGRRRLVLVRRDNMEHLLMIGGPTDIVVESNIVRAVPAREQLPQRPGITAEPPASRLAPQSETTGWDTEPKSEPVELPEPQVPELPQRPARPSFIDEVRRGAAAERREPPPQFPPEPPPLARRGEGRQDPRVEPRAEQRSEARPDDTRGEPRPERLPRGEPAREPMMPRQLRPAEPQRQAEAARSSQGPKMPPVRRPERPAPERPAPERVERAEPVAVPPPPPVAEMAPPPPPVQQSAEANLAEMAQRLEAALRRPSAEPPVIPAAEATPLRQAVRNEPAPPPQPVKTSFENLEDEMASLLGRPKSSQ